MRVQERISILVICAIHCVFGICLLNEYLTNVAVLIALSLAFILLIVAYLRIPTKAFNLSSLEVFAVPIVIAVTGLLTVYLNIDLKMGPIISSAAIGFCASYLPSIFKNNFIASLPIPIYCGTFVGMCGTALTHDYLFIASAGVFAGIFYVFTANVFNGIGGKLGTIAFGGVVVTSLIWTWL